MRIISAMTDPTEALITGTPEQQMQAQRERQAAEHAHAIISIKTELRRTDLEFGPRWITHTPTGRYFWIFGGEPSFAPNVDHYFVARDGTPTMLEPQPRAPSTSCPAPKPTVTLAVTPRRMNSTAGSTGSSSTPADQPTSRPSSPVCSASSTEHHLTT